MNLVEAARSGKNFRRPHWVEPEFEMQWCFLANENFSECQILWEDFSTFGDITIEMLFADDFEVRSTNK